MVDNDLFLELIVVLQDIKEEMKTTNLRLQQIDNTLDKIYGGMP